MVTRSVSDQTPVIDLYSPYTKTNRDNLITARAMIVIEEVILALNVLR